MKAKIKMVALALIAMLAISCSSTRETGVIYRCCIGWGGRFYALLTNGELIEAQNPGLALVLAAPGDTLFYKESSRRKSYDKIKPVNVECTGISKDIFNITRSPNVIFRCGVDTKGDFYALMANGKLIEVENPGLSLILAAPKDSLFYTGYEEAKREYGSVELVRVDRVENVGAVTESPNIIYRCGIGVNDNFYAYMGDGALIEERNPRMGSLLSVPGDEISYKVLGTGESIYGVSKFIEITAYK